MTHSRISADAEPPADSPVRHDAEELLPRQTDARVFLGAKIYTLRVTRAGKLILTK